MARGEGLRSRGKESKAEANGRNYGWSITIKIEGNLRQVSVSIMTDAQILS